MRILTTTLCYPTPRHPDQGIFVQRRALALAARPGVVVRVVSPQPWCPVLRRGPRVPEQTAPLPAVYPRMLSVPVLGWAGDGLAYAAALIGALRHEAAASRRFHLIDAHFEYPDGVGAWLAGRLLHLPVVVTVRGKIVSLSRRALRRLQIAAMLRGAQARIAVSRSLAEWVHRVAGGDLHVDVIPNGIDRAVYHPVDRGRARELLGWQGGAQYVLCVGHFQRLKGFDRVVGITPEVRGRLGDVRFILVGSRRGERGFQRDLQKEADRLNREAAPGAPPVSLLDAVDAARLNLMYNATDLLVSPSRSEGWCNTIAEALAAGTPVVATDVGGNREQMHSPALGMLVADGDQAALAEAVVTALTRNWDRARISALGSTRTWSQVGAEVLAVFARVLDQPAEVADEPIPAPEACP